MPWDLYEKRQKGTEKKLNELTDEQLDAVGGGSEWYKCGGFTIPLQDQ